jgi:nitrous oxidase accessory protein NosD
LNRSDRPDWDRQTEEAYGYSDAAITSDSVDRLLVTDIEADTPASGIVLRDTDRAVVDDVRINGADDWRDGFMGVVTIRSPAVVQDSTFDGGRDGVYTHRSDGVVIRDNRFIDGRFGTHFMYTSNGLFVDNCASGQALSGVTIMTSPTGVVIGDNIIIDTEQGIATSGSDSYIGGNIVVGTGQAIRTSARNSLYADNTVVGNDVGFRASAVFPTSVVIRNDVVDNERHVRATSGPLRVWSHNGEGNYWSGAEGLDRRYSPTDPVDGRLHRTASARALAAAPIVRGLRTLRGSVPGMRGESVVDAAPRDTPANPARLETAERLADGSANVSEVCSA